MQQPIGNETISVAIACDENLFNIIPTFTNSLCINTKHKINLYVLYRNLTDEIISSLSDKEPINANIIPIKMDEYLQNTNIKLLPHTTISTMDRIFLTSILKTEKRVIYLDLDIIINNDISILNNFSTGKCGLAARSSIEKEFRTIRKMLLYWGGGQIENIFNETNVNFNYGTFNAGVLVMDLDKLRANNMQEICMGYVAKYGINDQLALSMYANGEFGQIPKAWNFFANKENIKTCEEKNIIHWAGTDKPWWNSESPLIRYWNKYRQE